MQVMLVLGFVFALSKSDATAPRGLTRIGLQDDMTFIWSAAALIHSWNAPRETLGFNIHCLPFLRSRSLESLRRWLLALHHGRTDVHERWSDVKLVRE